VTTPGSGAGSPGVPEESSQFERHLGPVAALSVGLGTMIGADIFVLSADAASRAGPAAVASFAIAGTICVLIAMNVSELATPMPKEGGSYHLISRKLGPIAGAVLFVFPGLVPWQEIPAEEMALVEASGEALGSLDRYGMLGAGCSRRSRRRTRRCSRGRGSASRWAATGSCPAGSARCTRTAARRTARSC